MLQRRGQTYLFIFEKKNQKSGNQLEELSQNLMISSAANKDKRKFLIDDEGIGRVCIFKRNLALNKEEIFFGNLHQ